MAEIVRYGYLKDYGLNVLSQDVKVAWGYCPYTLTIPNTVANKLIATTDSHFPSGILITRYNDHKSPLPM